MADPAKKAVVIGAGIAGIAIALRLRKRGFEVTVLEKSAQYGGKLGAFDWNGFRWDKGPSLFTAPKLIDELFTLFGEGPREHFNYTRHTSSCSYFFPDNTSVTFHADRTELAAALKRAFGEHAAKRTLAYLDESKATYTGIGDFFIDNPPFGIKDVLRRDLLVRYPQFLTAKMRKTLHAYNKSLLGDEKLVQIFDRFGTYNGSNPYKMSGIYSMIPHLEQNEGTYFPTGGMRAIATALYTLAVKHGVQFSFGQQVTSAALQQDRSWKLTVNGERLSSGKVICAIDHLAFYRDVLKDVALHARYQQQERSTSAIVYYWAVGTVVKELGLHSIFFCEDYKAEFDALFGTQDFPEDPTIYIHISSAVNAGDAPEGSQNWFVMVNMPAGLSPTEQQRTALRELIVLRMKRQLGVDLNNGILFEKTWDARGIEADTGSVAGALYGASSNGRLSALKRHGNTVKKYPNLYFCGGTVHPGGGIPLVLKSAKIVDQLIAEHD